VTSPCEFDGIANEIHDHLADSAGIAKKMERNARRILEH
jgi:uncharacterized membrane-anchored protein YhcB (DUF1043 family)